MPKLPGNSELKSAEKIDVVIAWVDGNDPKHILKREEYHPTGKRTHNEAIVPTRFGNCGEIYYCIASILKYAKFINRIWIVADDQRPKHLDAFSKAGLCDPDFIQVVDHKVVFRGFESALPTFNSISIEAVVWRIPGLAERFVYMNDDFFFNSRLSADFLFKDGRPVLRGWMARPAHMRLKVRIRKRLRKMTFRQPNNRPSFRVSQERGAGLAGNHGKFLHIGHHPHPMRKSLTEAFFDEHGYDILSKQVSHRFRNYEQYNQASFANHLEITSHSNQICDPVGVAYYKPRPGHEGHDILDLIKNDLEPYGCLQSLDEAWDSKLREIQEMMANKFGRYLPEEIDFTA